MMMKNVLVYEGVTNFFEIRSDAFSGCGLDVDVLSYSLA